MVDWLVRDICIWRPWRWGECRRGWQDGRASPLVKAALPEAIYRFLHVQLFYTPYMRPLLIQKSPFPSLFCPIEPCLFDNQKPA